MKFLLTLVFLCALILFGLAYLPDETVDKLGDKSADLAIRGSSKAKKMANRFMKKWADSKVDEATGVTPE